MSRSLPKLSLHAFFFCLLIPLLSSFAANAQWSTASLSQARNNLVAATVGNKVFFAGGYGGGYSNVVDIYDNSTGTWSTATLSQGRYKLAAATVGNKVFFGGGEGSSGLSNVVDIYDNSTGTWSTATLSQARSNLAAASVGNKVFFAGGFPSSNTSNVVDIYDNSTNTWSTATLSQDRADLTGTAVGNKVFFAGGFKGGLLVNTVDIYDISTNTWSTATLSQTKRYLAATAVGNKVFFGGGEASGSINSNVVDIYDNSTNTWSTATLSQGRYYLAAAAINNRVFFGGGIGSGYSNVVDVYDNSTNTWTTSTLSQARSYLAAAAVGNKVFFGGGSNTAVSNVVDIYDNSIVTGTVTGSPFQAGASVSVPFTINASFNTGNTFTAQLSNASGSFAAPVSIGTLSGAAANPIAATIPAGTAPGTGYRIRVVASSPAATGADNGANIVLSCTAPAFSASPGAQTATVASGACNAVVSYTATATGNPAPTFSYAFTGATTASGTGTGSGATFNTGVTNVVITATNGCGTDATASFTVTVNAPEINVQGGTPAANIADGATTPATANGTDLGASAVGVPAANTFTIQNTGTATLNITSITKAGANAGDFVISGVPATVVANGSATFTVTFTAGAQGARAAVIHINNDDCDEADYDFAVQGSGSCATPTAFSVTGGGGYCIGGSGVAVGLGNSETGVSYQLYNGVVASGAAVAGTGAAISFGNQTLAGNYTVTATRTAGACTNNMTGSTTVTINALPTAGISGTATICNGGNTNLTFSGTANATVNYNVNGGSNQTITLNGSGTATLSASPLVTSSYTVTSVVSAASCTSAITGQSVTVTVNPVPNITNAVLTSTICSGASASITPTASSGLVTSFDWTFTGSTGITNVGGASGNIASGATLTQALTNSGTATAGTGTYVFTPKIGGCSGTASNFIVTVNPKPTITNAPLAATICSSQVISITPASSSALTTSFDLTYTASGVNITGGGGATLVAGGSISQPLGNSSISAAGTGTYAITPKIGTCAGTPSNFVVTVNPVPNITNALPLTSAICSGANASITPTASSALITGFDWAFTGSAGITNTAGASGSIGATSTISQPLSNSGTSAAGTGTYAITPKIGTCAGTPSNFVVTVNPRPALNNSDIAICSGSSTGITLSASTGAGSTFTWTGAAGTGTTSGITAGPTSGASINDMLANSSNTTLSTVIYTATPTGPAALGACQGSPTQITVTVNPRPLLPVPWNRAICGGGTYDTAASTVNGSTYTWTVGAITGNISTPTGNTNFNRFSQTLTNNSTTTAGTVQYFVTTTTPQNCSSSSTLNLTVNPNATLTITPAISTPICSGTVPSITLTSSAGATSKFSWMQVSTGNITGAASATNVSSFTSPALVDTSTSISGTVQYTITSTTSAQCFGGNATYSVTVLPRPQLSGVALKQRICSGANTSLSLNATLGSVLYNWTAYSPSTINGTHGSSIGVASSISDILVNSNNAIMDSVTYSVTTTSNTIPQCSSLKPDTIRIGVAPIPVVNTLPSSYTICSNEATNIINSATAPSKFSWTIAVTNGITGATPNPIPDTTRLINQSLLNPSNSTNGSVIYYVKATSLLAGCAKDSTPILVNVRPLPAITAPTSGLFKYCNGQQTNIVLGTSVIAGGGTTVITPWTIDTGTIRKISGYKADTAATISQTLFNSSNTVSDTITYNVRAVSINAGKGCAGSVTPIRVAVNPTPVLTTPPLSDRVICSERITNIPLTALLSTPGISTFKWTIGTISGSVSGANADSFKTVISQKLTNNSYTTAATVPYLLSAVSAEGCPTATPVAVNVTVNPLPKLLNAGDTTICSESILAFTPSPSVPLDSIIYNRNNISGRIQSFTGIKSFTINDPLSTVHYLLLDSVIYSFTMYSQAGCVFPNQTKKVYINPVPDTPGIQVAPANVCANNQFVNFSAKRGSILTPAQEVFSWSVDNGGIVTQLDSLNRQFALISFPNQGTATVTLKSKVKGANSCWNTGSARKVVVGASSSANPNVVFFANNLVCQAPNVRSYQWGFDLVADLSPTILNGETNQSYKTNLSDVSTRMYWVMATFDDGCTRKAYYNGPTLAIGQQSPQAAELKLYPNPAQDAVTMEFLQANTQGLVYEVYDLTGKRLAQINSSSARTRIPVADFAPGYYTLTCTQNGIRIATSRFIKN